MARVVRCTRKIGDSRFWTSLIPWACGSLAKYDDGRTASLANEFGKATDDALKQGNETAAGELKIESLEELESLDWQSMSYPDRRKAINCNLLIHASVERMQQIAEKAAAGLGSIQANVIRQLAASVRRRRLMLYEVSGKEDDRKVFNQYFNDFTSLIVPGNRLLQRSERLQIIHKIAKQIRESEQAKYTAEEVAECKAFLAAEEDKRRRKLEEEERQRLEEAEKIRKLGWLPTIGLILVQWFRILRNRRQSAKM